MSSIGEIIKEFRLMNNITRKKLSEDICTEKYIYLIETGRRTPSANVVRLISDKLETDLFDYYEYVDCINPILVKKYAEEFKMYRSRLDPELLNKSTNDAENLPDFKKSPWSFEIQINRFYYSIFAKEKYKDTIIEINKFLEKIKFTYPKKEYVVNILVLLSSCYALLGDLRNAKNTSIKAYELFGDRYRSTDYDTTITNIKVNIMTMSYLLGEDDSVIHEGNEIIKYKYESGIYDRIHYAYFYTAFAFLKKGLYEESIERFKKGMYLSLCEDFTEDIKYISMQDDFSVLINDEKISKGLASVFKKKYNIID